jgi:hypothetical protein
MLSALSAFFFKSTQRKFEIIVIISTFVPTIYAREIPVSLIPRIVSIGLMFHILKKKTGYINVQEFSVDGLFSSHIYLTTYSYTYVSSIAEELCINTKPPSRL